MPTLPRFLRLPSRSFFLFGPRGTGKSTWLKEMLPDAHVVELLRPDVRRELEARPERLEERVHDLPRGVPVVLDEVQRVPDLLSVVHLLMESDKSRLFVMTGSSARKLRRGSPDLLGGRASLRTLHPFMAGELPQFTVESALARGLVPLIVGSPSPQDALGAYAGVYVEQEVRAEGIVRDIGEFGRFLETMSFSHGSVLNVATIARDCAVSRSTVAGYLQVLDDLLLSFTLPVFTKRARRETSVHPKFYFFDTGLYRSLRPGGPADRSTELDGPGLEGLVAQHLRAWIAYSDGKARLSFWRTRSGVEVDFVVYGDAGFWAIDVQSSTTIRPADLRALKSFREDYPEAELLLVHRGKERWLKEGILCVPVDEFLCSLLPNRGLFAGIRR